MGLVGKENTWDKVLVHWNSYWFYFIKLKVNKFLIFWWIWWFLCKFTPMHKASIWTMFPIFKAKLERSRGLLLTVFLIWRNTFLWKPLKCSLCFPFPFVPSRCLLLWHVYAVVLFSLLWSHLLLMENKDNPLFKVIPYQMAGNLARWKPLMF